MAKKIKDYLSMRGPEQDIPLDEIEVNLYQVRTENVATDEAEFMHEMKIAGVNFSPILVCLSSSESGPMYDLIYGQRRLNAADLLNWKTIRGQIIEEKVPTHIGKAISYMENSHLKTPDNDMRDLVRAYKNDGYTQTKIHEELGLKKRDIQLIFWEEMLTPAVKQAAEENNISIQLAKQLQEKSEINGEVQEEKVLDLIGKVSVLGDGARKQVVKTVGEDNSLDAEQVIAKAKQNMTNKDYRVTFSKSEDEGLTKLAEADNKTNTEAILDVVIDRLEQEDLI